VCQLDTLAQCRNRAMLRRSLTTLPQTLDQTYDRILSSISEEHSKYAIRILQWLTFSARPLSVDEIAEVVAIDVARDPAFDPDEVLEDPLEALNICLSLVTITLNYAERRSSPAQRIITLAHHSVQEYLVSDRIKQGQAKQYSMQEAECHNTITRGSLMYLFQLQQPLSRETFEACALARYTAEFWSSHLQNTGDKIEQVSYLAMSLMAREEPAYLTWIRLYDPDCPWREPDLKKGLESIASPLYYGAQLGLSTIARLLLIKGADVNAQGGFYGNALQAASAGGHEQVVKTLLDENADVKAQGGHYGNALQAASAGGHEKVVKMLLDRGAEANAQGGAYKSALQAATKNGHNHIAKFLLENAPATTGPGIVPTDSGYASQRQEDSLGPRSIQDPESQEIFYSEEEKDIRAASSYEVEAHFDDIRSIESDHESIGSKVPTGRSKAELFAIKYLASFFAQLEDLHSLHEVALQKIERKRFTKNYRRILRSYYRKLLCQAANDTEKEATRIFQSRQNRESIAEGIANHLQHLEEEEPRPLAKFVTQPAEKQYLENWLRRAQDTQYDRLHEADREPVAGDYHPESSESGSDSEIDDDSEGDYYDFMNIDRAEEFLQRGSAFRNLVLDIRLLVLPGHLREIVETSPKSSLQLLSKSDNGWVNRTKAYLETYTGLEWDWWPLSPRIPSLGIEEHYLQWQVGGLSFRVTLFAMLIATVEWEDALHEDTSRSSRCLA